MPNKRNRECIAPAVHLPGVLLTVSIPEDLAPDRAGNIADNVSDIVANAGFRVVQSKVYEGSTIIEHLLEWVGEEPVLISAAVAAGVVGMSAVKTFFDLFLKDLYEIIRRKLLSRRQSSGGRTVATGAEVQSVITPEQLSSSPPLGRAFGDILCVVPQPQVEIAATFAQPVKFLESEAEEFLKSVGAYPMLGPGRKIVAVEVTETIRIVRGPETIRLNANLDIEITTR